MSTIAKKTTSTPPARRVTRPAWRNHRPLLKRLGPPRRIGSATTNGKALTGGGVSCLLANLRSLRQALGKRSLMSSYVRDVKHGTISAYFVNGRLCHV